MATGYRDMKTLSLPAGWDADKLRSVQLADGATWEQVTSDLAIGINLFNQELTSGYLGRLFSTTDEIEVRYRQGAMSDFKEATEYGKPDPEFTSKEGHMLPLRVLEKSLGWTRRYLERARRQDIDDDIAAFFQAARNTFEKALFNRLFKLEEETGVNYGLGSSGVSVPFADGGNGTIAFTPASNPARGLTSPAATHTHFLRLDGITQANLETAVKHLWEHGIDGPYELLVSLADIASWQNTTNVTGFKEVAQDLITYGSASDLARADASIYSGLVATPYGVALIYATGRVPTGYWGVTRSAGQNNRDNPLVVRYPNEGLMQGFGVRMYSESAGAYPLQEAVMDLNMGVGVYNRVAAVLVENDTTGDYATPTIV